MDLAKMMLAAKQLAEQSVLPYPTEDLQMNRSRSKKQDFDLMDKARDVFVEKSLQEEQEELMRLQYDFEFIQHLTSADYVKYLNRNGFLEKPDFINYLTYLKYWRKPEYLKLLVNPKCLDVLDLLLRQEIREELKQNEDFADNFAL